MFEKKKYVISVVAIILAVVLLTGSASRQNMNEELPQETYTLQVQDNDPEWAHRPAIEPESRFEGVGYYSTVCIDEPPTEAEMAN